jgi:hypothetical protein
MPTGCNRPVADGGLCRKSLGHDISSRDILVRAMQVGLALRCWALPGDSRTLTLFIDIEKLLS